MRWWREAVCATGLALFSAFADSPALNRFEVYPLDFADPASAEEAARHIVADTGSVSLDLPNRRLLVVTTEDRHAQIAAMIKRLNVAPKNVRIDVRFRGSTQSREREASISGRGQIIREDGITHSTIRIEPRIIDQTTTASGDVTQTLLVASGREGFLQIGESVPYVEWLMDYGLHWGYLRQRVQWQQVGARLVVEPTVVGDGPMIRIRLTPELTGLVDGRPLHTRFSRVATEVVAQDGQTFQIGGLDQDQDFYSRFLVGVSRSGTQQSLDILMTPRIMEMQRQP